MDVTTRYARLGERSIAYQAFGAEGPTLVVVPAMVSHVELMWGDPKVARFLRRLASFARVVVYDKLGTGLSDPVLEVPTVADRARELQAVLDDVGVPRASLFGLFDGGATALFHAASRPDLVERVVLYGTHPVGPDAADVPDWEHGDWVARFDHMRQLSAGWGDGRTLSFFSGTNVNHLERQFWSTFERSSASPGLVRAMVAELAQRDLRDLLAHVHAPTLVLHHRADPIHPLEQARLIVDALPAGSLVPVGGPSRWPWAGDPDAVLAEVRGHLTGVAEPPPPGRSLATILFTDIVGSTEQAAAMGDDAWRPVLEAIDLLTREVTARHGGRFVKSTGDGALMVFDAPSSAVRCALDLVEGAPSTGVRLRAGLHSGEVEHLHDDDIGGLAVHVAARVCGLADADEVLLSGEARDLLAGADVGLVDRGSHRLKGVPDPHRILAASAAPAGAVDLAGPSPGAMDRAAVGLTRRAPAVTRFFSRLIPSGGGLAEG